MSLPFFSKRTSFFFHGGKTPFPEKEWANEGRSIVLSPQGSIAGAFSESKENLIFSLPPCLGLKGNLPPTSWLAWMKIKEPLTAVKLGWGSPGTEEEAGSSVRHHLFSQLLRETSRPLRLSPLLYESIFRALSDSIASSALSAQSAWLMIRTQELLKQVSGLAEPRKVGLEANAPPISPQSPALLRPQFLQEGQNQENLQMLRI